VGQDSGVNKQSAWFGMITSGIVWLDCCQTEIRGAHRFSEECASLKPPN
jgi:hypothetical protein